MCVWEFVLQSLLGLVGGEKKDLKTKSTVEPIPNAVVRLVAADTDDEDDQEEKEEEENYSTTTNDNKKRNAISMSCGCLRSHCLKVVLSILVLLVLFQCGIGFIYEERRRLNEAYFTFNLTLPLAYSSSNANDHGSEQQQHNGTGQLSSDQHYSASTNMTLVALQSSNSSDPFPLDLLAPDDPAIVSAANNSLNITRKPSSSCPLVSPLLSKSLVNHM